MRNKEDLIVLISNIDYYKKKEGEKLELHKLRVDRKNVFLDDFLVQGLYSYSVSEKGGRAALLTLEIWINDSDGGLKIQSSSNHNGCDLSNEVKHKNADWTRFYEPDSKQ